MRSRLDALNLTAWDVPVWQEMGDLAQVGQVPKEFLKLPLVSANVRANVPNFPLVRRYIIKDMLLDPATGKHARVGITGLLSDPEQRIARSDFQIQDPVDAAGSVVNELMIKSDYRIVLTDMDIGSAISLAVKVPKIDLIVVSHDYPAVSDDQQVGQTLLVVTVNQGRALSEIRMNFGEKLDDVDLQSRVVPLDSSVPDDPILGELVKKAQAAVDKFKQGK